MLSLLVLIVLLKNGIKRDYEKCFLLALVGIFFWSLSSFGQKLIIPPDEFGAAGYTNRPDTSFYYYLIALYFSRLVILSAGSALLAFLYFSFVFPRPYVNPRELKILKYTIVFLFLFFAPMIVFTDFVQPKLFVYWAGYGIWDAPVLTILYALTVALLSISTFSLFNSYRKSDGLEKKQIKIILYGGGVTALLLTVIGLFPVLLTNLGIKVLPQGMPMGPIVVIPFELSVIYSILKYRLFDVQLIIRNGLINGISVGISSSVVSVAVFIPYFLYKVEAQIIIISLIAALIFLILIQKSLKTISTRIVEFFIPSLKWKECKPNEIYLIHYPSGLRLTSIASKGESRIDPDIVSGMLTSVTNFVRDSFHAQDRDTIRSLVVGNTKLMVEHSKNAFMVVVFTGFESSELRTDCQKVLNEVEAKYGKIIKNWNGNLDSAQGIEKLVAKLLPKEEAISKEPEIIRWAKRKAEDAS